MIGSVEGRSENTPINTGLVSDDGIFLVVTSVACDCNDSIASSWKLFEMKKIHRFCTNQRLLRIVEDMSKSIHSEEMVAGVDTHCLFAHCTLISVPRRLVMIWERNDRCADT